MEHLAIRKSSLVHHFLNYVFVFRDIFIGIPLQIYSVVNGVAHVVIYARSLNINGALVDKGFADCCEENYMSKVREV